MLTTYDAPARRERTHEGNARACAFDTRLSTVILNTVDIPGEGGLSRGGKTREKEE